MHIKPAYLKLGIVVLVIAGAVVALRQDVVSDMSRWADDGMLGDHPEWLWYAGIAYCLCLAVPFMPGIEIGIVMMLLFGRPGVITAYLATVLGLSLAFAMGRGLGLDWLPSRWRETLATRFGHQADTRLSSLEASQIGRVFVRVWGDHVIGKPWLLLAVLLNLPGNWVLGGGGGISLAYGMQGTVTAQRFVLTVAVATSIVPVLVFFGLLRLEPMLKAITSG